MVVSVSKDQLRSDITTKQVAKAEKHTAELRERIAASKSD